MSALTWVRMVAEQPIVWVIVLGLVLGLALLVGGLWQTSERRPGPGPRRFKYRRLRKPAAPSVGVEQPPTPLTRWRRVIRSLGRKKQTSAALRQTPPLGYPSPHPAPP